MNIRILLQAAVCLGLASGQNLRDFDALPEEGPALVETFQRIRGLPAHQQGFVQRDPRFKAQESGLSGEQREAVRRQQEFRRKVAQANRERIHQLGSDKERSSGHSQTFHQFQAGGERTELPAAPQTFPDFQAALESFHNRQAKPSNRPREEPEEPRQEVEPLPAPPKLLIRTRPLEANPPSSFPRLQLRPQEERPAPTFDEDLFRRQAEGARYSFQSAVADSINDHSHVRQEVRDGLKLSGLYSYSDGFFKRTVHYEADENGYRVVKEESEPIGSGPKIDPSGKAEVSSQFGGNTLRYSVTAADMPSLFEKTSSFE